jgi:hypothetical protein
MYTVFTLYSVHLRTFWPFFQNDSGHTVVSYGHFPPKTILVTRLSELFWKKGQKVLVKTNFKFSLCIYYQIENVYICFY